MTDQLLPGWTETGEGRPIPRRVGDAIAAAREGRLSPHTCRRPGCGGMIGLPRFVFCDEDWRRLPQALRDRLWNAYTPGQDRPRRAVAPSAEWLRAFREALGVLDGIDAA